MSTPTTPSSSSGSPASVVSEDVELSGHIIDSLLLPKVLDEITNLGGEFEILEIRVGQHRQDPSHARLRVSGPDAGLLEEILTSINQHGAVPLHQTDVQLVPADLDGAFPEGFTCTTNQETEVRLHGNWVPVADQEMDCGIVVDPGAHTARCVPMTDVRRGEQVVIGRLGTRVRPAERSTSERDAFRFMNSTVSSEKPKGVTVREIAHALRRPGRLGTHPARGRTSRCAYRQSRSPFLAD